MSAFFVTAVGTDVGKTHVAALLLSQARQQGRAAVPLKPVASGAAPLRSRGFKGGDTARLLEAAGQAATTETVAACTPFRFSAPLSPDMAAAAEGRRLPFADVALFCRRRLEAAPAGALVLIEGAGGIMSPIADDGTNLDLLMALDLPAVLVAATYLGALSHALTALEALKAAGGRLAAVVLNETPDSPVEFEATLATLKRFAPEAPVTPLRRGAPTLDLRLG
jgi:dethiobiotin synthetase